MTTLVLKNLRRLFDKYAVARTEHDALVKSTIKIFFSNCVAFSENLNFKQYKYCMNPRPRLKGWNMQICTCQFPNMDRIQNKVTKYVCCYANSISTVWIRDRVWMDEICKDVHVNWVQMKKLSYINGREFRDCKLFVKFEPTECKICVFFDPSYELWAIRI